MLLRSAPAVRRMSAFEFWLRTGRHIDAPYLLVDIETKFNHRHYTDSGQFARAGEGQMYGPGGGQQPLAPHGGNGVEARSGIARSQNQTPSPAANQGKKPPQKPGVPRIRVPTRKEIIAYGKGRMKIQIRDNPAAVASAPPYELHRYQQVTRNDGFIRASAGRQGVDPDLIRAIVYVESTHGYYDAILSPFDANSSILPMNINTAFWGNTWGTRDDLKNPAKNIEAGARMLKSIRMAMPGASISKIATIYNDSGARMVNSYGARVQAVYRTKPWLPQGGRVILPAVY